MASSKEADRIVYILRRETQCGRCQRELWQKEFICLTGGEAICLDCAGIAHLEYLPVGDPAVTRRATKYSDLHVVVMKKSPARKRSERQGVLVEAEAIRRGGGIGRRCREACPAAEEGRQAAGEGRSSVHCRLRPGNRPAVPRLSRGRCPGNRWPRLPEVFGPRGPIRCRQATRSDSRPLGRDCPYPPQVHQVRKVVGAV